MSLYNSHIIAHCKDSNWRLVSVHNGGRDLRFAPRNYYSSHQLAEALIALGDMSSVGPTVGQTIYYGRDRNERWDDAKPRVVSPLQSLTGAAARLLPPALLASRDTYIWGNGPWEFVDPFEGAPGIRMFLTDYMRQWGEIS